MEAAAGRTLNVMFPMVSEPWEYEAARGLFVGQRAWLASHNKKLPVAIRYGAMLEVPGLVETLDLMLPHLDFLSVRSEEHTSELQSLMRISYAVFCLKKKKQRHRYLTSKSRHTYYQHQLATATPSSQ